MLTQDTKDNPRWDARDARGILDAGGEEGSELSRLLYLCIEDLRRGEVLHVISRNPRSAPDVERWCQSAGHELLQCIQHDGDLLYWIRRTSRNT